jgi:hypothetical protein
MFIHNTITHHWVGYGPLSLCVIHKEDLCPSSEDIASKFMMIFKIRIASEVSN